MIRSLSPLLDLYHSENFSPFVHFTSSLAYLIFLYTGNPLYRMDLREKLHFRYSGGRLYGKSVSGIRLLYPRNSGILVPLGKYSGTVLVLPNLALLEFSVSRAYRPPAEKNFREHFLKFGLTPAECGAVSFRLSLGLPAPVDFHHGQNSEHGH